MLSSIRNSIAAENDAVEDDVVEENCRRTISKNCSRK